MNSRSLRTLATASLVVAGLAFQGGTARAAFSLSASATGSAQAGATYATLDNLPAAGGTSNGLNVAFNGSGAAVTGSVMSQYVAPVLAGANNQFFGPTYTGTDTTTYASSGTGQTIFTFANGSQNYLGLLWGSVDTYNSLTFFDASNNVLGTFTGSDVIAAAGGLGATAALYVNINSTIAFSRVVASSGSNSFEIDNVAYAMTAVPEPSSFALCGIAGLIGASVARKRARRTVA